MESVTTKTAFVEPVSGSLTLASAMEIAGALSSSVIVTVFVVLPPRVALAGVESTTVKSSSGSSIVSPVMLTKITCEVDPGANVTRPLVEV